MPGLILAGVNPDNTPSGFDWTFLFPMLLFIVIGTVLYLLFSRPHRRVPGRPISSAAFATAVPAEVAPASAPSAPGVGTDEAAPAAEAAPETTKDSE